jgi:serine/threonine protein kinase
MSEMDPDPIETLLDEFVQCLRRGESPSIATYEAAHPECAEQIRELFPAVEAMEQVALRRLHQCGPALVAGESPTQLGDFRIIREIGRGGMGIVYEAEQESLARHVAVKVLPPSALLNPVSLERFHREARTAAQLHHTNIVPVFGVGEQDGFHYLVMQLIQGVGLDQILAQLAQGQGALSCPTTISSPGTAQPSRPITATIQQTGEVSAVAQVLVGGEYWKNVAQIGAQAAAALHYAHQRGTLHRDVKPANLLLDRQGIVWITDFGLAKAMEHDALSQAGDIVGTLRYMAPERFQGEADARSDIYSLGLTLYELLTLRPAYESSSPGTLMRRISDEQPLRPRAINPAIPRDLETIVLKAIAREPAHRYPSGKELADDLGCFLEDQPIRARRLGAAERLWRWSRRNRAVASLIGLAAALLVLVAAVATVGYVRTTRANARVREALAGQSQQREKAEAISALTLEALDDIFEQYLPNRVAGGAELPLDDAGGAAVRVADRPVLSKGAAALLERMLVFYDRLAQQNVADTALRRKVADANRRVGDIHRRLGHFEQAQGAYLTAIEGYQKLQQEVPGDATATTEIARIDNEIGDLHWAARWEGDGRSFHTTAMLLLKAAPPEQTALPSYRYELARTHYFLGRGAPPDAAPGRGPQNIEHSQREDKSHLQQAIQILKQLIAEQPSAADDRHLLACCYRDLPVQPADASQKTAFDSADRAIEILQKLATDFPDVPDYRLDLSKTYARMDLRDRPSDADLYSAMEQRLRKSLKISEQLITENPIVPDYAAAHVHSLYALAEVLRHARRPAEAETLLRKALAIQSALAEQFPKANAYILWKAILQESLAKMLSDRGRTQEARELLESAVAALNPLLQSEPQAAYIQGMLGRCYRNLSAVLSQMGEKQQAAEMLRRGREHRPER